MPLYFSPAKINLFLRVLRKRSDGYHDLASLFQTVTLGDWLSFEKSERDVFITNVTYLDAGPQNLIIKALHLFREKTGLRDPFHIELYKKIPCGAGLGGGSSNAATALYALNQIFQNPLSLEELKKMGKTLGADVPFFFSSGSAYVEGIGDILSEVPTPQYPTSFWIVSPDLHVKTQEAYLALKLGVGPDPENLLEQNLKGIAVFHNDFEASVFQSHPMLYELKSQLQKQCSHVLMSGSGSSFFCLGNQKPDLPKMHLYPINFITRSGNKWYEYEKK